MLWLSCWFVAGYGCDAAPLREPNAPAVARTEQRIIDGAADTESDSVVAVFSRQSGSVALCSGSVIGPYQVMTAKHCVFDHSDTRIPPSNFSVIVGDDLNRAASVSAISRVSEVRTTPGHDIENDVRNGDDIAILLLPTRLAPTPLPTATRAPVVGSTVTIVGFGRTMPGVAEASDAGVKFIGTTKVTDFDSHLIQTNGESATCEGDSGGPMIDDSGAVAGITSFGLDMECFGSTSLYTRVSRHAELIDSALSWTPECPGAKPEACNGVDDNCDGIIDEICRSIGEDCSANAQCEGGLCARVEGRLQCTIACDPTEALPECPSGTRCHSIGCGTGRCIPAMAGDAMDGATCVDDGQCASGHCGVVGDRSLCGRPCRLRGGDACPAAQVCDSPMDGDGCGTCVPVTQSNALRPFGSPCEMSGQCQSTICNGAGALGAFCTRTCDSNNPCGASMHCRDGLCQAGSLGTSGSSCVSAMDCGSMASDCVARDGDAVCAAPCEAQMACDEGFACEMADDGSRHCLRTGTALGLACQQDEQCASALCEGGHCVRACSASTPCPSGLQCEPSADLDGTSLCQPMTMQSSPEASGCNASGRSAGRDGMWWLALGCALWMRRRLPLHTSR